jgi:polyhydroxyalkanoate synthesis regulator phasin
MERFKDQKEEQYEMFEVSDMGFKSMSETKHLTPETETDILHEEIRILTEEVNSLTEKLKQVTNTHKNTRKF